MSDDWDQVTKIGAKANGGGARATVARTQSEINAARRSGAVIATEKKVIHTSTLLSLGQVIADKGLSSTLAVVIKPRAQRAKDSPRSTVKTRSLPPQRST